MNTWVISGYSSGLGRCWTQSIIDEGGFPFMDKKSSHYRGWMRFNHAPEKMIDAHLIALIDTWCRVSNKTPV